MAIYFGTYFTVLRRAALLAIPSGEKSGLSNAFPEEKNRPRPVNTTTLTKFDVDAHVKASSQS